MKRQQFSVGTDAKLRDVTVRGMLSDIMLKHGSEDDDEVFVYPAEMSGNAGVHQRRLDDSNGFEDSDDKFIYPSENSLLKDISSPSESAKLLVHSSGLSFSHSATNLLESIYLTGTSGNLESLQSLFLQITSSSDVELFSLANDVSPLTGLNVIHAAASRGHLKVVKWCELYDRCVIFSIQKFLQ